MVAGDFEQEAPESGRILRRPRDWVGNLTKTAYAAKWCQARPPADQHLEDDRAPGGYPAKRRPREVTHTAARRRIGEHRA